MGFEIGGHTSNHVNLGIIPIDEAKREIVGSKEKIEEEIGDRITALHIPSGAGTVSGKRYFLSSVRPASDAAPQDMVERSRKTATS